MLKKLIYLMAIVENETSAAPHSYIELRAHVDFISSIISHKTRLNNPGVRSNIQRVNAALNLAINEAKKDPCLVADVSIPLSYVGWEWGLITPLLIDYEAEPIEGDPQEMSPQHRAVFSEATRIPGLHIQTEILNTEVPGDFFIRMALVGANRMNKPDDPNP